MNSFFTQVSSSIRILGWNRDASARATHLKAAGGNVPSATIERKSMSTKTSIKRIALVAAAALAIGGFSAVSASATTNTYIGGSLGDGVNSFALTNTTLSGIAGPANFVKVGVATGSTGILTISGGTFGVSDSTTLVVNTAGTQAVATAVTGTANVSVPTPSVGTITVSYYKQISSGVYASTATESVVITVNSAGVSGVPSVAKSSAYIVAGLATSGAALAADPTTAITATSAVASPVDSTTAAATIQVFYADGNGTAISSSSDSVTATISSGPGAIKGIVDSVTVLTAIGVGTITNYSTTLTSSTSPNGYYTFVVWPNGQVGTTVVTIKNAAGTVLATKSLTFAGTTVASIKVKNLKTYILNSNTATKNVFAVNTYDSAGNEITSNGGGTITATAATGSTVGSAITCDSTYDATDGYYTCSAGATLANAAVTTADNSETWTFSSSKGAATTTATGKATFVSGVLASATVVPSAASADPGTKVTYTLTVTGANGSPMPDGAYKPGAILVGGPTTNVAVGSAVAFDKTETTTLVAGVATDYTYAPFSGVLQAAWTLVGTAATAGAANYDATLNAFTAAGVAKALAATTVTADDVTISANTEATAAANAATDAANQAADAADNATQAAAEALAAVNTLATTVATLIDGIKSQIKALNTLILAIKKKIKA